MADVTFKEKFRDFQELAREHDILRKHNLAIGSNAPQDKLLLFAEGGVVIMSLERFLRMLPGVGGTDSDTLRKLLKKAVENQVLNLPGDNADITIERVVSIRNTILHGNFEQAARQAGLQSKEEYFKKRYDLDIEELYKFTDNLVDQIDPDTGERKDATKSGS